MSFKILLLPDAKDDVRTAREYYNIIVPLLGKRFIKDLRTTFETIAGNPFIYASRMDGFRTANLIVFPYQVHDVIEDAKKTVVIFAVSHAHRDPGYIGGWANR